MLRRVALEELVEVETAAREANVDGLVAVEVPAGVEGEEVVQVLQVETEAILPVIETSQ